MKKFPIHLQHDSMQCGTTCLQMICEYYGIKYTLNQLAEMCYATIEGISLLEHIENVSFIIPEGKITAIVGAGGSGQPCFSHRETGSVCW